MRSTIATSGGSARASASASPASWASVTRYRSMRRSVSRITRHARSSSTTRTVAPTTSLGGGSSGFGEVKGTACRQYTEASMGQPPRSVGGTTVAARRAQALRSGVYRRLVRALSSCATEADLVQVLYAELHPVLGYDSINLQVLEREGWYHSLAIDGGVLQDVRRRLLVESFLAGLYRDPVTRVMVPPPAVSYEQGRGPGVGRRARKLIWIPVLHGGSPVGSV